MRDETIEFVAVCGVIVALVAACVLMCIFGCGGEKEETEREERVGLGAWSEEWREAREWQVVKLEAERRGE